MGRRGDRRTAPWPRSAQRQRPLSPGASGECRLLSTSSSRRAGAATCPLAACKDFLNAETDDRTTFVQRLAKRLYCVRPNYP